MKQFMKLLFAVILAVSFSACSKYPKVSSETLLETYQTYDSGAEIKEYEEGNSYAYYIYSAGSLDVSKNAVGIDYNGTSDVKDLMITVVGSYEAEDDDDQAVQDLVENILSLYITPLGQGTIDHMISSLQDYMQSDQVGEDNYTIGAETYSIAVNVNQIDQEFVSMLEENAEMVNDPMDSLYFVTYRISIDG